MWKRKFLDVLGKNHHAIKTNHSPRLNLLSESSSVLIPKIMNNGSLSTPSFSSVAWYHQSLFPNSNNIPKQNIQASENHTTTQQKSSATSVIPKHLLGYVELLFPGMSVQQVMRLPPTTIDEHVLARVEKAFQKQPLENKADIFDALIRVNQIQYIPPLLDIATKSSKHPIISARYIRDVALSIERKGNSIAKHKEYYHGFNTKEMFTTCSKCIDLIIANSYNFVHYNNVDVFVFILALRVKMFKHSSDFYGLKKYFENQLKPLIHKYMSHPTSICTLYNTLTSVLIEMDQLDYLYEIYADNMTIHFNLLKRSKAILKGAPLFVTIHSLLTHVSRSVALINTAARLSILAVEFFDMAKADPTVDQAFIRSLSGNFIVSFVEHFEVTPLHPLQPLHHYFSLYLNFVSHFWNLHGDVANAGTFAYVSVRFLYLYARLTQESAFDISSSREAEYVYEQLLANNISLSAEMYYCLLVIFSHTRNEKKCLEIYESALLHSTTNSEKYYFHHALINAYSIMGDFEKALALATQMKKITAATGNVLLKTIATMCLPNLKSNYTDDYIQTCIERALQLLNDEKVEFDGITLNTLINIYGLTNKLPTMLKYFQILVDDFNEDGKYAGFLNAITFTTIIKHLCSNRQFDSALDTFKRMKELSIRPTVVTYKVLIEGMILVGQDCLPLIMQHMKQDGINMEDHLIGSIVFYYAARTEDEKQLLDVLKVVDRHRDEYTPKVYEHLVLFYTRFQDWNKAARVILQLLDKGITPTIRTFSHMIQRMVGYMDAFDLLHILHPDESFVTQYVEQREEGKLDHIRDALFTKEMDHGLGLVILKNVLAKINFQQFQTKVHMHSRNHHMNRHACFLLMNAQKQNLGLKAAQTFVEILVDLFADLKCRIFEQAAHLMLLLVQKEGGSGKVRSLFELLSAGNNKLDVRSFNVALQCILTTESQDSAWNFYHEIVSTKSFSIRPDLNTLELLIRAARNESDFEILFKAYKQMTSNTKFYLHQATESMFDFRAALIDSINEQLAVKEQSLNLSSSVRQRIKIMKDYLEQAEIVMETV
ncbi:hypothetical protein C9374_009171 [Naegleria lovaniensis]|uniref:Pentatricopeptide repeat-containing protein n=1 Tax=Naegleria lovaniensis TaxID=51637 RepID=A0AA88GIE6_NAELO|nr:uncharacterized protein C9374_009171 [Naegleria lovaniensis]KAG2377655.1 hypothetical protein C9374_009171 [Naegleria lovaniensis]